jgi:hypothetical protein
MPDQGDDNGNGFPTEEETRSAPGPDEVEELGIDPDRPGDDEGFATAPEVGEPDGPEDDEGFPIAPET